MAFVFDATQHEPRQVGGKHPPGNKFPFTITATEVKETKDNSGSKFFQVTLTSPAGSIPFNYNLWNPSNQAKEIAVHQLSALCHATGIFKVNFANDGKPGIDGKELIGGKGLMDVGFQSGHEPSADKPEGGYVEIKKIYDVNGNEPGKGPQQTASSGFGQTAKTEEKPAIQQNWGGGADKAANQATGQANQAAGQAGGWQQNANAGTTEKPPWGQRLRPHNIYHKDVTTKGC